MPCGHKFCQKCIEVWEKQKGVDSSCPLCRTPLPPGPAKLFDLGIGLYIKVKGAVERGRPGADPLSPWPVLSDEQQREMVQAVVMLREAADQGWMGGQVCCGNIYGLGHGVTKDDGLGLVYTEKAAQQGHIGCEYNTGWAYETGHGCEQDYARAAEWYEKAARQGYARATNKLGCFHKDG